MKRQITISLDADMAHALEIRAAIDNLTLAQGITELVEFLAERLLASKKVSQE